MAVHHCHLKANGNWKGGLLQHPKHPPESATGMGLFKLLPTAVLVHPLDGISLCHIRSRRYTHCFLSPNGCFNSLSAPHPPPPPPIHRINP